MFMNQNKDEFLGKFPFKASKSTLDDFITVVRENGEGSDYGLRDHLFPESNSWPLELTNEFIIMNVELEDIMEYIDDYVDFDGINALGQLYPVYVNFYTNDYFGESKYISFYDVHYYNIDGVGMIGYFGACCCDENCGEIPCFTVLYFNENKELTFYTPYYGNLSMVDDPSSTLSFDTMEEAAQERGFGLNLFDEDDEDARAFYISFVKDYAKKHGCVGEIHTDCPEDVYLELECNMDQIFEDIRSNMTVVD